MNIDETKRARKINVNILRNDFDEFEVPTPTADYPESIYYTDDKNDAIETCRVHYFSTFSRSEINIRVLRGTYTRN